MLDWIMGNSYNRSILIGRPNLTIKDVKCQNITCGKADRFKKYDDNKYICECGYHLFGEHEIQEAHKVKFYCKAKQCPENKVKMDKSCLKCQLIGER